MPLLSVHCVVTQHDGLVQQSRRDAWIEAQDFPQLVLAATAQLRLSPDCCEYRLFAPDVGTAFVGVLLEVVHDGLSALVGPMAGPAVPAALAGERTCTFDELITSAGFGADAPGRGLYPVTVVYADSLGADALGAGFLGAGFPGSALPGAGFPGVTRGSRASGADYRLRCAAAERVRLARGRHEGFHALRYDVPVDEWRAADLEALIARAYALLPAHEPCWRESGIITHDPFSPHAPPGEAAGATAGDTPTRTSPCALEVQRGDFVAYLNLPAFPVAALADWLARRPCEISLRQPMGKRPVLVRERPWEEVAGMAMAR